MNRLSYYSSFPPKACTDLHNDALGIVYEHIFRIKDWPTRNFVREKVIYNFESTKEEWQRRQALPEPHV
jgi:hypothetical protein